MAKKNDKPQQPPAQTGFEAGHPSLPAAEVPAAGTRTVTNGQLALFWGVVVLIISAAWVLDYMLPGTSESVIERWLMLPFGAFLVFFLFRLK